MTEQKNYYQDKWESRSSIRSRPRKVIDFGLSGDFFPEEKQVLMFLPEVQALGEEAKQEILIQSFFKYANDIINLEIKLIVAACSKIIYNDLVVDYSESTKLNAYTVIIDEYYHVYTARDMIKQLKSRFSYLPVLDYPISDSYNAVETISQRLAVEYRDMFEIIAVCIFETTLVRELVEFFDSPDVHTSIKNYVNDHMNDEAKHYGYFYDLLCYSWHNLPKDYKQQIGPHLADFVKLYLHINSEKLFNLNLLTSLIKDADLAVQIIDGAYQGFDITTEIPIVKNVLRVLKSSGILDDPYVVDSFKVNDLYI